MHGCHLRGFARTDKEITKQLTIRILCWTCWLCTPAMGCNMSLKIHFLESHLDFFPENLGKVSDNRVKGFTKTLWLRKSGTKASGPHLCWQNIAGLWRGTYLTPNTGESRTPQHFGGKFLPVSWARKVQFCTCKFLCIFETLPNRKKPYLYGFSDIWINWMDLRGFTV